MRRRMMGNTKYSGKPLTSANCIGLFHIDNNINDSSGNSTEIDRFGSVYYINGKFNTGMNGIVSFKNTKLLDILKSNSPKFTVDFWVKPEDLGGKPSPDYNLGYVLSIGTFMNADLYNDAGNVTVRLVQYGINIENFRYSDDGTSVNSKTYWIPGWLSSTDWSHIAIVVNIDTITVFVCGKKVMTMPYYRSLFTTYADIHFIGGIYNYMNHTNIDEIAFSNEVRFEDDFEPPKKQYTL